MKLFFWILLLCCVIWKNDFGGYSYKTDAKFERFVKNKQAMEMVEQYTRKEIRTVDQLLEQLLTINVDLSKRCLENYLRRIKAAKADEDKSVGFTVKQCFTQHENERLFLVGKDDEWRKFRVSEEYDGNIYISCQQCEQMQIDQPLNEPVVSRAIIRTTGKLEITSLRHREGCESKHINELEAEQIDREKRRALRQCVIEPKAMWREGREEALMRDVQEKVEPDDETSLSFNYPSWTTVKRSFNRIRQQGAGPVSQDPFDLADKLQLTRVGAAKLLIGQPIGGEKDLWCRFRSRERGVMVFMTHTQINAAKHCKVIVADATFELAPRTFRQIWTLHGLYTNQFGSEWTPLAMVLMTNKEEISYQAAAYEIRKEWDSETFKNIERIHVDYEQAEINALANVFGNAKVYGCLVHYTRAVMRHIRSDLPTLFRVYKEDKKTCGQTYRFIRRVIALPLLRQNERRRFWNHEKVLRMDSDEVNGDIGKFFRYMENNWFAKMEGANENIWNFNRLARTRSTNPAEAFHSMIKRDSAAVSHANIRTLLTFFQITMFESDQRIIKLEKGKEKPRKRDKHYETLDNQIDEALVEYEGKVDQGFVDDNDFGRTTRHYLNRLSHLLLELDSKGKTPKEQKIQRRRKEEKLSQSQSQPNSKQILGAPKSTGTLLIAEESSLIISGDDPRHKSRPSSAVKQSTGSLIVAEEGELTIIGHDPRHKVKSKSNVPKSTRPLIGEGSNSELTADQTRIMDESCLHTQTLIEDTEPIFDAFVTAPPQMMNEQILLYNPLTEEQQREFCEEDFADYRFQPGQNQRIYPEQFEFSTNDFGPGKVEPIIGDGNCGFRSLSFALTGTEINHAQMRLDMMGYLENSVRIANEEVIDDNWWKMAGDTRQTMLQHANRKRMPARDASEVEKWMSGVDFLVAARLYAVNVIVCESVFESPNDPSNKKIVGYRWRIYSPSYSIESRIDNDVVQDRQIPSVFIYYSSKPGHFEVINRPELFL